MKTRKPYRVFRALLRMLTHRRYIEEIEGDLDEEFQDRMARMSPVRAQLADAFHTLSLIRWYSRPHLDAHSIASSYSMLKNYIRTAFRSSRKQAGFTSLNLVGLAMGLACFLIVSVYIGHHVSFDQFHKQADNLYRITKRVNGSILAGMPAGLAPILEGGRPDIRGIVRTSGEGERIVSLPESQESGARFTESGLLYVDSDFLNYFDFPLARGNPVTALHDPSSIVLTSPMASKYFGEKDPVGLQLILDNNESFTVTGVLDPLPANTAFEFDFLLSFDLIRERTGWRYEWQTLISTYILLESGADPDEVATAIPDLAATHTDRSHVTDATYYLQPITDIHLYPGGDRFDLKTSVSPLLLRVFGLIGFMVLCLACINYVNLATARSMRKAREVGMRKAVGARRGQIAVQFLTESILTCLAAGVLAFATAWIVLPLLAQDLAVGLHQSLLYETRFLAMLFAVTGGIGFLSGAYPAWYLSRMEPSRVLTGGPGSRTAPLRYVRKGLVVFQFAVSVFLLVGVLVIRGQLAFVEETNLGFDRESTIAVPLTAPGAGEMAELLMDRVLQIPGVKTASIASGLPGIPNVNYQLDMSQAAEPGQEDVSITLFFADAGVLRTLGLNVVEGQEFPEDNSGFERAALINRTTATILGWEDPVGRELPVPWGDHPFTITGVVEDFHYESLRSEIGPVAILPASAFQVSYVVIRLDEKPSTALVGGVQEAWTTLLPEIPFQVLYVNEMFENMYRTESRQAQLLSIFSVIALFIAILGIIGLASHAAERRRKELGIRRVLGASTSGLVALLNREFLLLVMVGAIVGSPIAYFLSNRWLESFAYRIQVEFRYFAMTFLFVVLLAILVTSYQSIRAALAPPADVIRTE